MRRKKHKSTRRTVRFYKISFGFKEPYKVLIDGNFLHTYGLACQGQAPIQEALSKLLGAPLKLFTSRCITRELKEMGNETQDTLRLARKVCKGAECPHEGQKCDAATCITDLIGKDNKEHFYVATQDVALRRKLMKIPAVPRIFLHANGLILEEPSATEAAIIKKGAEASQSLGRAEHSILADTAEATSEKSKFRRKKAKGPNPLAVQKKKTKKQTDAQSKKAKDATPDGEGKQKRPRRKKQAAAPAERNE